jgi:hypothetical protein
VTASCKSQTHERTASPRPRHLLAMSHVLDDIVALEDCGGRRKFGETEDTALVKGIVANDDHVCRRGKVTETFEEVSRALNEGNTLPWNTNGKHCNDRYKLLLAKFRRADRAHALASGTEEEFGVEISCLRISSMQSMTTKSVAEQSARNLLSATFGKGWTRNARKCHE